jgi:hypothetical protein
MDVCCAERSFSAHSNCRQEYRYGIFLGIWSEKITLRSFEAMGTMIADLYSGKLSSPEQHWPQSHSGKNSNPGNTACHRITMTALQVCAQWAQKITIKSTVYSDKFSGPG